MKFSFVAFVFAALCISSEAAEPQVAIGWQSMALLRADGTIWGQGNLFGDQWGAAVPVSLSPFSDVIQIANAGGAIFLLRKDGSLWASGNNTYGALGDGSGQYQSKPVKILDGTRQIAASYNNAVAVRTDGTVWTWGRNDQGQLGTGDRKDRDLPTQIVGLTHVIQVDTGGSNSFSLRDDGTVWAWGSNCCGQLANGVEPLNASDPEWNKLSPVQVVGLNNIIQISKRGGAGLALKRDGTVWVWGSGFGGEMGDNGGPKNISTAIQIKTLSNIRSVVASNVMFAVGQDGSVYGWGTANNGELGPGVNGVQNTPLKLAFVSGVASLDSTAGSVAAILADGTVRAWGDNSFGQLGRANIGLKMEAAAVAGPGGAGTMNLQGAGPTTVNRLPTFRFSVSADRQQAPVTVTATATEISDSDGQVSTIVMLASDGQQTNGATTSFTFSKPGTYQIVAIARDNGGGAQIRVSDQIYVAPLGATVQATPKVVAAFNEPMVLGSDSTVRLWGVSWFSGVNLWTGAGPPPNALTSPRVSLRGAVSIAAAQNARYVIMADGSVIAWGINTDGQLGTVSSSNTLLQTIPGLSNIKSMAAGWGHALALDANGKVWVSGRNDYGQLGIGDRFPRNQYQVVPGLPAIEQVAASEWGSFARDQSGNVWTWGRGDEGAIGDGLRTDSLVPKKVSGLPLISLIVSSAHGLLAKAASGSVWAWGGVDASTDGPTDKPGLTKGLDQFRSINCYYACAAIASDGTVWTWGNPSVTPLGDGSTAARQTPGRLPSIRNAVEVAVGFSFMLVRLQDGTVVSWGENEDGKLGNGTVARDPFPHYVISDNGSDLLDLDTTASNSVTNSLLPNYFLQTDLRGGSLSTRLTDLRAKGFDGDIYFTALLPATSPIVQKKGQRDGAVGMVPVAFTRGGYKQTGPSATAEANASGAINTGSEYIVYEKIASDPLANSNAIICMGLTLPALSAKGQVLMRAIATGDQVQGVAQCPTVQTEATTKMYLAQTSGTLTARTITATINPLAEDRGQMRNIYSWAIIPDGRQFMQTGPNTWSAMVEPMQAAMNLTVPASGLITLPVLSGVDLSSAVGTLVYVGMGATWEEVRSLNMAGHYYTVQ